MKSIVIGDDQTVKRSQSVERMPLIIEEEEEERGRISDKLIDAEDIEQSEDDSFTEDEDLREEMKELEGEDEPNAELGIIDNNTQDKLQRNLTSRLKPPTAINRASPRNDTALAKANTMSSNDFFTTRVTYTA